MTNLIIYFPNYMVQSSDSSRALGIEIEDLSSIDVLFTFSQELLKI